MKIAYNWKPGEYINKNAPFTESPEGQKEFLEEVNRIVMSVPDNRGVGVFWWEPAVTRGSSRASARIIYLTVRLRKNILNNPTSLFIFKH